MEKAVHQEYFAVACPMVNIHEYKKESIYVQIDVSVMRSRIYLN